jgi:WD40 repeat protein
MSEIPQTAEESLALAQRLDAACCRFEDAWSAGQRPCLEHFLAATLEADRPALLLELISLEVYYRRGAGDEPQAAEYQVRFPALDATWVAQAVAPCVDSSLPVRASTDAHGEPSGVSRRVPGSTVARTPSVAGYEILDVLGRGAMGVVYRARHVKLNRVVALKMILAGEHAGRQELARFRREAEAVAQVQHPNIVQIYEIGEQADRSGTEPVPYLALEYVDGGSLDKLLAGTPQDARAAAVLVQTLALAMNHAHQHGIVHRDLKPANVLLQIDDCRLQNDKTDQSAIANLQSAIPKITDFGLAKRLDAEGSQTQSGALVGTPSYMAPEQALGQSQAIGPVTDVYALGAILYELLTGRPPFRAATVLDTLEQVRCHDPVPPGRLQPKVPRDLETICLKALAKEPGGRYPTAQALADDLRRWLGGEPIQARPVGARERAWRWARRRPAVAGLITVTAVAVLAVGAVIAALFYSARLQEAKDRAETAAAEADKFRYFHHIDRAYADWRDGNLARVGPLLDACPEGRRGWEWQYLQRLRRLDLLTLTGHTGPVNTVAVSPDGTRIASASYDRTVKIWELDERRAGLRARPEEFSGATPQVCVAFSPDGARLASGDWSGIIKLWDLKTGESFALKGHPDRLFAVAFSPDGTRLASSGKDSAVKVWDLTSRRLLADLDVPRVAGGLVLGVAFSPDGKLVAASCPDRTVKLWQQGPGPEGKEYTLLRSLKGPTGTMTLDQVAFSPDGTRLASATWEGTVLIWGEDNWRAGSRERPEGDGSTPLLTLKGHTGTVKGVAFSPDGARLVSGSSDGTVKVWDLQAVRADVADSSVLTFKGHTSGVNSVAFTPDGTRIISGSRDQTVKVWDSTLPQECQTWKGHTQAVMSVAWSAKESRLASASRDGFIKIWDTTTGKVIRGWKGHQKNAMSVVFSPDGQRLASSDTDKMIKVWDAATGKEITAFPGHTEQIRALAFSPDGARLASASDDHTARIWEVATGRWLELKGHETWVRGVAFSPDGTRLATAGFDQFVKIWDATSGQVLHELSGHDGPVWSVAFSPDGSKLASASRDTTVRLWDVKAASAGEPELIFKLPGHRSDVSCLAFNLDGSRLASGSDDHTVRIWDLTTGQEALCLKGHTGWVWSVAFGAGGTKLASAGLDRTIKIWDAAPLTPESAVEREATGLLAGLFGKPLCSADVIDFLKTTPTIRPQVLHRALALVTSYRQEENADHYHQAARDTVRRPYLNALPYGLALRQAEAACRLVPGDDKYTITRGMALYRVGRYQEARAMLTKAVQARENDTAGLAFLAMAQHRLAEPRQAQETVARLRASMQQPGRADDAQAQAFLREAEALLLGPVAEQRE